MKDKTMKPTGKKIGESLYDFGVGKDILARNKKQTLGKKLITWSLY